MHLDGWSMAWDVIMTSFQVISRLWWVFALALLLGIIKAIPDLIMNSRARKAGVDKVDSMDGKFFEIWLAHQFRRAGYTVKRTRYQKDHGVDLILTTPKGTKIAIQAKKLGQRKGRVGAKALGEVIRGQKYYNCDKAMMVTNQGYTEQAREEARKIGIELVDRENLIAFVNKINAMSNSRAK